MLASNDEWEQPPSKGECNAATISVEETRETMSPLLRAGVSGTSHSEQRDAWSVTSIGVANQIVLCTVNDIYLTR